MIILCDDAFFVGEKLNNFLWVTFTRSNPSHDIDGIGSFVKNKHWGCNGPLLIDARIKPHHAPAVELDAAVVKKTDKLFSSGGSLHGVI
jgi:4-hydroxy-3-polyprenylbenzoate decarboxylase